ncbi:hypothetical protein MOQ72_36340 [Saccharopolyspora sp. K220]|uniref:hypothetical protein n=1 Tax=Saccharopolyspora soli TaxID=2926618 RepID=UPI001F5775F8|nr:hypothetical protein [Saccharopolyspora soli]MCI2422908.1 hypothetical protein [Saccharopolyspora soli]
MTTTDQLVDQLADDRLEIVFDAMPTVATITGVPGRDDRIDDVSEEAAPRFPRLRIWYRPNRHSGLWVVWRGLQVAPRVPGGGRANGGLRPVNVPAAKPSNNASPRASISPHPTTRCSPTAHCHCPHWTIW